MLPALAACATNVPEAIREAPPDDVSVAEVRRDSDAYTGRHVRWGGTIAGVENGKTETRLEVVARDLDRSGRPRAVDRSAGRFVARVEGFLDPAVYSNGRQITIAGTLAGATARTIGEYPYRYPVVKTETVYLWEPPPERERRSYYHEPFWGPWGPWGSWHDPFYPYPWWRR